MKKLLSIVSGMLLFSLLTTTTITAQLINGESFMQGKYIEVGVSSGGVFGTVNNPPEGYHPRANNPGLGFVADANQDGWDEGDPNYCGDYFVPGAPEEGWGIEVEGINYGNFTPSLNYSSSSNVPGSITNYSNSNGTISVTWVGNKAGLNIEKTTFFPENALYFVTQVIITNTTSSSANDIYYFRNVDPDNEQPLTGNYSTFNEVISQPGMDNPTALVQATGLNYGCYVGLGTIDRRARATFGGFTNRDASSIYEGLPPYNQSGSGTADVAMSLSFFLGDIPAGESVSFSYAYILEEGQLEEALDVTEDPIIRANGVNIASVGNTIEVCKGEVVEFSIIDGEDYDWTWSPSSGLSSTTGTEVTASPDETTTYTITGTRGSEVISVDVTVQLYPFVTLPEEILLPYEGSLILEAAEGFDTYQWDDDDASTTQSIEVTEAGIYTVTVSDEETGCTSSASVEVIAILPNSLTLEPETITVITGEEICITGTVYDQFGELLKGVEVFTEVDGEVVGSGITNENGEVEYCFTPTESGVVNIVCYYEGGNRVTATVTVTIDGGGDPVPTSLTLEPNEITVPAGEEICIMGTVYDQFGDPLEGIEVFTEVDGEAVGSGTTDANGEVKYCFTPTESGNINIVCYYEGGTRVTATVTVIDESYDTTVITLIDSETDTDILEMHDGDIYALEDLPEMLAIRADVTASVGSLDFNLNGPFIHRKTESNAPYAIFGNVGNDYTGRIFPPGNYELTVTPYSQPGRTGVAGEPTKIGFTITNNAILDNFAVIGFDLYDAVTDSKIMDLIDGTVINLGTLDHNDLTVLINTLPDFVGSVKVELMGPVNNMRIENSRPYTLFENNSVNYYGRAFLPGSYTLMATPYSDRNAQGSSGTSLTVNFTVEDNWVDLKKAVAENHTSVYPVPFVDNFFVKNLNAGNLSAKLFNLQGQTIALNAYAKEDGLSVITPATLREGIYILKLYDEGKLLKTVRVQKKY